MAYLRRLGKKTDGSGQSQAEGGETHNGVDRQDEPRPPLQQGEPAGTRHSGSTPDPSVSCKYTDLALKNKVMANCTDKAT